MKFFLCSIACISMMACSGGSGGGSPTAPAGTSPSQVESLSYSLLNTARAENGVDPQLDLDQIVAQVARDHSRNMRDQGFFGHEDGQGRTVADRLSAAGISFSGAAENLGTVTNAANPAVWIHNELMGSSEHRPNILNPDLHVVGVGVAIQGDTVWVTQVFVTR